MDKIYSRTCKHCGEVFEVPGRVFSNHVRWCDKNPVKDNSKIQEANKRIADEKYGEKKEFEVKCYKCNKQIVIVEREFSFCKDKKYYCNRTCANSHVRTEESKDKIRKIILQKIDEGLVVYRGHARIAETRICLYCNKLYETYEHSNKKYCDRICAAGIRKRTGEYATYRRECKFKFNLWHYPDEFDLGLVKKYGWYKPMNRGNNLGGVSRDHKISVKYGWENDIPADIIAHPANCELLKHTDNISKHSKCSLLLEELVDKIKEWDKKYN